MKIAKLRNLGIFYKIMGISAVAIVVIILWNILYLLPQMERIMLKEKQNAVKDVVDVAYSMLNDYDKRVKINDIELGMAQMAAIKSIQQLRYRGENYFWINDTQPKMIVNPVMIDLEGQDVSGFEDPRTKKKIFVEMTAVAKQKQAGFYEYNWKKAGATSFSTKQSYIKYFEPWGWVIGSGMYLDDVNREITKFRWIIIGTTIILALLVFGLSYLIASSIRRNLNKAVDASKSLSEGDLSIDVSTDGSDETGQLLQSMENMISSFNTMIGSIKSSVDNLDTSGETALPQAGLARADVVFEEIVEGNITRLVAVFHSKAPNRIGPIRSARTTDVHLIPQLGPVLFAWSGGNDGVVAEVRRSPFLIDLGHDAASSSYSRERGRRAPHNLFVEADELWDRITEPMAPPNQIFQFRAVAQPPSPLAEPARGVDITWGGGVASSPVDWRWDPDTKLYLRGQNGRPHLDADGSQVVASNVVVMITDYGRSAADTRSPEAHTVGEGELFVYTDGHVVWGRWSRPADDQPATLTDTAGNPILLTPGTTWVELPRSNSVTTIT